MGHLNKRLYRFFHPVGSSSAFFKAVFTIGFVEQPPFGILPSVFELVPGQAIFMEVGDETVAGIPTSL